MSYTESKATCDWCNQTIDSDRGSHGFRNGGDIACRSCHEALEDKVSDLEKEIAELKSRILGE